jgi:hypothetical protein
VRDSGTFRQARPVAPEQAAADLEAAAEAIAARARRQRTLSNPSLRKVSPSMPPPPESAFDLDIDSLGQTSAPSRARASRKRRSERPARKSSRPRQPAPVRDETSPSPRARPAAAFGQAPAAHSRSIFGDNVSSEKSLDEVILSYLADDIEESSGGSK